MNRLTVRINFGKVSGCKSAGCPNGSGVCTNELFEFLKQIIDIRNEHAHIKAMSLEKFDDLNNLLFTNESNIKKLLNMKKEIKNRIDTNS